MISKLDTLYVWTSLHYKDIVLKELSKPFQGEMAETNMAEQSKSEIFCKYNRSFGWCISIFLLILGSAMSIIASIKLSAVEHTGPILTPVYTHEF